MPQTRVSNTQQEKLSVQHLFATTRGECVDADIMLYTDFVTFCMYVKCLYLYDVVYRLCHVLYVCEMPLSI